jgi:hypothetical protein
VSCLLLQISLLVTVLGGLSVLRKDAEVLVLGPLRSMLKIVAQYAKNPLSSARTGSKAAGSDDDTEGDDSDDEAVGNQVGNYETEQLITAVSKITDLLRKCWGEYSTGPVQDGNDHEIRTKSYPEIAGRIEF